MYLNKSNLLIVPIPGIVDLLVPLFVQVIEGVDEVGDRARHIGKVYQSQADRGFAIGHHDGELGVIFHGGDG